jgi:hypothetical protein
MEGREFPLTGLPAHPVYDPLRGDERFQALVARVLGRPGVQAPNS